MRFNEFLQDIALGELSSSNLVELQAGQEIVDSKIPVVIQSLNQALRFIYTEFNLKDNQVIIALQEGISRYYLDSDYSTTVNDTSLPTYIMDTTHLPFTDDVLKITGVHDINGRELTINDPYSSYGIHTPEFNCVMLDGNVSKYTDTLTISYRASHSKIPLNTPRNSRLKINIPVSFETALQTYVASLVYMNNGGQDYLAQGNALYAKFMTQLEQVKTQDIGSNESAGINLKPILGEWI